MSHRWQAIQQSFRALPRWVQGWVGLVLVPVNIAPFGMLDSVVGRVAASAALLVAVLNLPIIWIERGFSRALSLPHLLAWGPLLVWLCWRGIWQADDPPAVRALVLALLLVNGLSLLFDLVDSLRWLKGERQVFRPSPMQPEPGAIR